MSRGWFSHIITLSVVLLAGGARAELTGVSRQVSEQVATAVVEISARDCDGAQGERIGTGFAYMRPDQIVTANHVIAGCKQIELWYERSAGQPRLSATVVRVLKRGDLALLRVDSAPSQFVLTPAAAVDDSLPLKAIGYAVGQPTLGDLDLSVSIGSDVLQDMLPPENRAEIARETEIDLNTKIVRFSRPLYPGMSGGPIFDGGGRLVAVTAGGLKNGAVAASWGWPARLLADLLTSTDSTTSSGQATSTQFAYMTHHAAERTIRCGNLTFQYRSQLSFGEIAASSDNSARLDVTVAFSTRPRAEIEALKFDIWFHPASGATIAVPDDAPLEAEGDHCVARSPMGVFEQLVTGAPAANINEINFVSIAFENILLAPMAAQNVGWYPDQVLSFNGPQFRQDGLEVNRKAFYIGKSYDVGGRLHAIHQFETLMARGGAFVGIASVNTDVEACMTAVGMSLCAYDPNYVTEWAKFVLATQMSTYPIY